MKIAWGITGAGHQLKESAQTIKYLIEQGHQVDLFISQAGEVVGKMYGVLQQFKRIQDKYPSQMKNIYYGRVQHPGYPICAKFNLGHYDKLIISPVTSNSVAKMNCGIADTLITNIFAQMIKGAGQIYLVPTDLIPGKIQTVIPDGRTIEISIDELGSEKAKALTKFPNVQVFSDPNQILKLL